MNEREMQIQEKFRELAVAYQPETCDEVAALYAVAEATVDAMNLKGGRAC